MFTFVPHIPVRRTQCFLSTIKCFFMHDHDFFSTKKMNRVRDNNNKKNRSNKIRIHIEIIKSFSRVWRQLCARQHTITFGYGWDENHYMTISIFYYLLLLLLFFSRKQIKQKLKINVINSFIGVQSYFISFFSQLFCVCACICFFSSVFIF